MLGSEATSRSASVEIGDKPPRAGAIDVVVGAECLAQQSLLGLDPGEDDKQHQHSDEHSDACAKR